MNILFIGGDFGRNQNEIRSSGYVNKLFNNLSKDFLNNNIKNNLRLINGGNIEELKNEVNNLSNIDILFWFPNISNDEDKLLPLIKSQNPKLYLIQSKYNGGRYSFLQLVARALQSKANLLVEFNKDQNKNITSKIIDPLGNVFYNGSSIEDLSKNLVIRLIKLINFTRQETKSVDSTVNNIVPEETEFFQVIENYGDTFHNLIHAINQDRFLGNASFRKYRFRCSYGFPSFKENRTIFVSRRLY